MFWLVFMVVMVMWLLGFVSDFTFGGFLHVLLIVAVAAVLVQIFQDKRHIL